MRTLDDVTLYIPARNAGPTLHACLHSVAMLDPAPARTFVLVDDQSSDDTLDHLQQCGLEAIVQTRRGLAAARNQALAAAQTPWVASLDADVVVAPTWLGELAKLRRLDHNLAGVCGRTEEVIRGAGDLWRALMHPHHWGDAPMLGPFMLISEALMHRPSVMAVGGYREHLTSYGEDSQLSRDLRDAGFRLAYTPFARAAHIRQDTPRQALDLRWNYARPRAQSDLEDLAGVLRKQSRNIDFARAAFTRARAAGTTCLQAFAVCLPFHHVWRDVAAMLAFRNVLPETAQAITVAVSQALLHVINRDPLWQEMVAEILPEIFTPLHGEPAATSLPVWPKLADFCQQLTRLLQQWLQEFSRNGSYLWTEERERSAWSAQWPTLFGASLDEQQRFTAPAPLRSFSPWSSPRLDHDSVVQSIVPGHWQLDCDLGPLAMESEVDVAIFSPEELPSGSVRLSIPRLETFDDPRHVLEQACDHAHFIEICYTPPLQLDQREVLLAADLAQACARANLEVIGFDTLVTTTRVRARKSQAATQLALLLGDEAHDPCGDPMTA